MPTNTLTVLIDSFVQTFKYTTDFKYNLVWSHGMYLQDIPQRLGRNESLDTAVAALTAAHSDVAMRAPHPSIKALTLYTRALQTLREYLNDTVKARASETLCAVMLLLICQVRTLLGKS